MSVFKVIWQFKSNVQSLSCFWLVVTPMVSSTPGFLVLHCLLEFAQIHVHWVMDATPFSSCPQSFPTSGSFPVSWLFTSGDQSIGASASVLPVNIQGWFFFLGLTGLIFVQSKGLLRAFSSTTVQKHQFFDAQPSLWFISKWQSIQYSCLENTMDRGAW